MINFSNSQGFPIFISKEDKLNESIYGGIKVLCEYPERMLTKKGKEIAKRRVKILQDFLKNLEEEFKTK